MVGSFPPSRKTNKNSKERLSNCMKKFPPVPNPSLKTNEYAKERLSNSMKKFSHVSKKQIYLSVLFLAIMNCFVYHRYFYTLKHQIRIVTSFQKRPFKMPREGEKYKIFQPYYDMDYTEIDPEFISTPGIIIPTLMKRIQWLDPMLTFQTEDKDLNHRERAIDMYLEMLKSHLSAVVFNNAEKSVQARLTNHTLRAYPFNPTLREGGDDWTYMGDTMTGHKRLDNVKELLFRVVKDDIPGDYIETGVWRGGSSVFARAVITALEESEQRVSYVCDSFAGLPPGERALDEKDKGWGNVPYLEVSDQVVAGNFNKYGLLDSNVVFVKGFFNETMPPLSKEINTLAIMRLDGDMYESTVDVLYHLYDKLSIGGFVIMDDWEQRSGDFPSKTAVKDFFAVHNIDPKIIKIDRLAAYWQKMEEVDIQYWRYEQSNFKPNNSVGL